MRHRTVIGIVAPRGGGKLRAQAARMAWSRNNIVCEHYIAKTSDDLALRLSEMFLHDRRAYLVDASLAHLLPPLLDRLSPEASALQRVDIVLNVDGVLIGHVLPSSSTSWSLRVTDGMRWCMEQIID